MRNQQCRTSWVIWFKMGLDPCFADCACGAALQEGWEAVIVDTAGRLQIDAEMMGELAEVRSALKPTASPRT